VQNKGLNGSQPPANDLDLEGLKQPFKHPGNIYFQLWDAGDCAADTREEFLKMQVWKPSLHFHAGLRAATGDWSY